MDELERLRSEVITWKARAHHADYDGNGIFRPERGSATTEGARELWLSLLLGHARDVLPPTSGKYLVRHEAVLSRDPDNTVRLYESAVSFHSARRAIKPRRWWRVLRAIRRRHG